MGCSLSRDVTPLRRADPETDSALAAHPFATSSVYPVMTTTSHGATPIADDTTTSTPPAPTVCCDPDTQQTCCEASEKAACCGEDSQPATCGCEDRPQLAPRGLP